MAIVRKTDVIQVRCHEGEREAFAETCKLLGIKPTERIRRLMAMDVEMVRKKAAAKAKFEASRAVQAQPATSVPPVVQKAPVEAIRQPQSLSERRKAEKAAKLAKKAKREDRYFSD